MTVAVLNRVKPHAIVDRHEDELAAAYERVLRDAGRRAASRFKRLSVLTAAADQPTGKPPNWTPPNIDELVDLALIADQTVKQTRSIQIKVLAQVVNAYGETVSQITSPSLGPPAFDVINPASVALVDEMGSRAGDVAKSVRDDLQKIIGDAYQDGFSVNRTADQIIELSDQFSKAQSRMLARTDLNGIANGGSVIAAREVGVAYKTWLATEDERIRPTHQEADGQTVPIDQLFDVGGEAADYPGDPSLSDEEACNCRCTVVYSDGLPEDAGADLQASGVGATIGGQMTDPQITIPLNITVGAATAIMNTTTPVGMPGGDPIGEPGVEGPPGVLAAPDRHSFQDSGDGTCAICGATMGAAVHADGMTAAGMGPTWRAVLCVEGEPTEDGRLLEPGAISWRDLPLSLLAQTETASGHDGAEVCGRIDRIWRDGNTIMGEGSFDSGEFGAEIARLVNEQTLRGVSVDLAVLEYEIRPAPDVDDTVLDIVDDVEVPDDPDELFVVTDGVIGAATICAFQAIANATIEVLTSSGPLEFRVTRMFDLYAPEVITAAAAGMAPLTPPGEWFNDPALEGPTPITITDDGRVFGHAALWNTCHVGVPGSCVTAPRSRSGYRFFHLGAVFTDDAGDIPVGQVTIGTGHAPLRLGSDDAMAHYDNTGTVAADGRVGEDRYGIWFAGALRPDLNAERVRALRGSKLSGDWRNINGQLELVGLLAVNVPGFPVPRPTARVASAGPEPERLSLVAAGVPTDPEPTNLGLRAKVLAARARGGVQALAELAHS